MRQEQIIWSKGIARDRDPRQIGSDELWEAFNMEVIEAGTLSKRKGFGVWSEAAGAVFADTVRGLFVMYDKDGNRYLFAPFDATPGTDLRIEKNGVFLSDIEDFFPSTGYRVRAAVFGDKIYFVNGVDKPRWYKEYDGASHVWGIAGVPSVSMRVDDESDFDYFISRALYADCITSSEDLGIELPGIWRYKQAIGYCGKESDQQVEESNAGPASPMFHCQFNTAASLSATLEGYIKRGVPIGIAGLDDLILDYGESGGQDYGDEIRWMRLYRQWKMFSDELYSPFEHLVEMKKGWPTSINDVYQRDSAVVAPTTRISLPVAHHIANENNRLFLGRVEKETFTQPGLIVRSGGFSIFRGLTDYKPNFSYRMPITIINTNSKTLTAAVIPLRFQNYTTSDHMATPPSGGGTWVGAYIDTSLDLLGTTTGYYQMIFVDEDGVTPLGFFVVAQVEPNGAGEKEITFLVEIPEIAAGGSRTIYLYFEDSQLASGSAPVTGGVGHWKSIAHYPLCASDHILLMDFENWKLGLPVSDVTQKRILAYIADNDAGFNDGEVRRFTEDETLFFGDSSKIFVGEPCVEIHVVGSNNLQRMRIPIKSNITSTSEFTVAFLAKIRGGAGSSGHLDSIVIGDPGGDSSFAIVFTNPVGNNHRATVFAGNTDGDDFSCYIESNGDTHGQVCHPTNDDWLYYVVSITGTTLSISAVYAKGNGHPAEEAVWDDGVSGYYVVHHASTSFFGNLDLPITGDGLQFFANIEGRTVELLPASNYMYFKEIQVMFRGVDGQQEALHLINRDTYFPGHGLATAGDRESKTGEKHPDRMYFSRLNQPNSFEALDFRDMGKIGRPIQGIRGIRNRLFVFSENEIKSLFSAGAEQTLALGSGDTTTWILSQDLTGEIGGLGVLAPDTLVNMEFAGRDGVGFLSKRGFYFFDGQSFEHLSQKVDNIIDYWADSWKRVATAHFCSKKRQLILGSPYYLSNPEPEEGMAKSLGSSRQLIANLIFAGNARDIVWTKWQTWMKYAVELDAYEDDYAFVFVSTSGAPPFNDSELLKLEANDGDDTYVDLAAAAAFPIEVDAVLRSKRFELFDSELLSIDLDTERSIENPPITDPPTGFAIDIFADDFDMGNQKVHLVNPSNKLYRFPVGTNGRVFQFRLSENSASSFTPNSLIFFFNKHGYRRINA